jgi:hypothetical protein
VNDFGSRYRKRCDEAGASIAAENGATDEELMAIYDWVTKSLTAA